MLGRRMGRGGLVRAAATTAVVAGTATAVSGRVASRQNARAQQAADAAAYQDQQAAAQQQMYAPPPQQQVYAPPPQAPVYAQDQYPQQPSSGGGDLMDQLQSLANMHTQGILSDAEFATAKAKLLA